jgi:tRNA pseudouridine(55) synthase
MNSAFVVFDKPAGITSHDVVAAVRAVTGVPKVGHTGTLDPFATGVLPIALGGATRLIQFLDESIKVYEATILLGSETDTGDPTGVVTRTADVPELEESSVREVLARFVGEQMQVPPAYSAVKKDGKPLYQYARAGEKVEVEARKITLYGTELMALRPGELDVRIRCSRGTYARVLANDIAAALGTVGHLSALARARSGPFFLEHAVTMQQLGDWASGTEGSDWKKVLMSRGRREERVPWRPRDEVLGHLAPFLASATDALSHLPAVVIDAGQLHRLRTGGVLPPPPATAPVGGRYLVAKDGDVYAIAQRTEGFPELVKFFGD